MQTMSEPIDTSGDDLSIARWIWRHLVPKSGQSGTVQGELLRAVEKLRWEAQNNGNINWDEGFLMLVEFLRKTLNAEPSFGESELLSINADLDRIRHFTPVDELEDVTDEANLPYVEDDLYDRLVGFVAKFARQNPMPIARDVNPALFR
jgi:hypothetical protein